MSTIRHQKLEFTGSHIAGERPRPLGRVSHDSRGNAIWDWAIQTDVFSQTHPAELLQSLQPDMALENETSAADGWHGDPYNRTTER